MDEKNSDKIILTDREILDVNGVINVEKFTDDEIILETNQGQLQIKGEKMYMKQLSLDAGLIVVEGNIKALIYLKFHLQTKGKSTRSFIKVKA